MTPATEWRSVLKPDEQVRVASLDARIDYARDLSKTLTAEREIIRRRAVGRIRLATAKNG